MRCKAIEEAVWEINPPPARCENGKLESSESFDVVALVDFGGWEGGFGRK